MKWIKASERLPPRPKSYAENTSLFVKDLKSGAKKVVYWGPVVGKRGLLTQYPWRYAWLDENALDEYGHGYLNAVQDMQSRLDSINPQNR